VDGVVNPVCFMILGEELEPDMTPAIGRGPSVSQEVYVQFPKEI
jgi:hypothetical protein